MNKKITILLIVLLVIVSAYFILFANRYDAQDIANDYLNNTSEIKVTEENNYYFFDGSGDEIAFVFYPGAKVEEKSYARLMHIISQSGIDCYILKLPLRIAFFNANGADEIISNGKYKQVYVGGHSLGGVVASTYADKNIEEVAGLILIESRANVKLEDGLKVLSIYSTNDGILNKDLYENAKSNLPSDFREIIVEGGNHSGLADYGEQKGDNKATISKEEQQDIIERAIVEFVKEFRD